MADLPRITLRSGRLQMEWDEVSGGEINQRLILWLADPTQLDYDFARLLLGRRMHVFVEWGDPQQLPIRYDVIVGPPGATLDGGFLSLQTEVIETIPHR